MSGIEAWAGTVSICAVISCIIEMAVSDTKLEKTVKFVLGAFMLCAVVIPLGQAVQGIGNIDFEKEYVYEQSEDFNYQKEKILKEQIKALVENILEREGLSDYETEIDMNIDSDNSIKMITARINLSRSDSEKYFFAAEKIRSELGIECVVN